MVRTLVDAVVVVVVAVCRQGNFTIATLSSKQDKPRAICRGPSAGEGFAPAWLSRARPIGDEGRFSRGPCAAAGQSSYTPRL